VTLESAKVEQVMRYSIEGSRLAGTREVACLGVETRLDIRSTEPPERIRRLVEAAEHACFTLQALQRPVPTALLATLNGGSLD
jgi:organic hydroperoxide reductase OsmC/OhrA